MVVVEVVEVVEAVVVVEVVEVVPTKEIESCSALWCQMCGVKDAHPV